jgi:hypothetical protein
MAALEKRIETLEKIHSQESCDKVYFMCWNVPDDRISYTTYGGVTWKKRPEETKSSFTSRVREEVLKLPRERSERGIYLWLYNE